MGKKETGMKKTVLVSAGWILAAGMIGTALPGQAVLAAKRVTSESGETSSEGKSSANAGQKAGKIEGLNYIGGKTYTLNLQYSKENSMTGEAVGETGVLAAVSRDFDYDGADEIFSVSYKDSTNSPTGRAITFSILKETDGGWKTVSEQEMLYLDYQGNYREMSGMSGGTAFSEVSVFLRRLDEQYQFFYEVYEESSVATGQSWNIQGFYLDGDELKKMETSTDIFYEGSPISELWDSKAAAESGEDWALENANIIDAYENLIFSDPNISFDHMTVDQNQGMYQVLRMKKGSLVSDEERSQWISGCYNGDEARSMKCYSYKINDLSNEIPNIIQGYRTDVIFDENGTAESSAADTTDTTSEFIIPDSDSRYLSREELSNMSLQQLNYAKNEIYARKGRVFQSPELQNYFGSKSWYHGSIAADDFKDSTMLNDYERANTELLSKVEHELAPDGYQLDK